MRNLLSVICAILSFSASISPSYSISISVSDTTPRGCKLLKPAIILSGRIEAGDADLFSRWLIQNRERVMENRLDFALDSLGGSVAEALRIAGTLEEIIAHAFVPAPPCGRLEPYETAEEGSQRLAKLDEVRRPVCVSACFILVVGALSRGFRPQSVGLHRPFLEATAYQKIDAGAARQAHEEALSLLNGWLRRKGVPQHLIEAMAARSSKEIYWLTSNDQSSLGAVAPWLEEYAIARCDFKKA